MWSQYTAMLLQGVVYKMMRNMLYYLLTRFLRNPFSNGNLLSHGISQYSERRESGRVNVTGKDDSLLQMRHNQPERIITTTTLVERHSSAHSLRKIDSRILLL